MKSDVIAIDNLGNGFKDAIRQTEKVSQFRDLGHKEMLHLVLCTEEMLSLARSITGDMKASFWIESEGRSFDLHMSTNTLMDRSKREAFLSTATSKKNDAANSFIGKLRDTFEEAMMSDEMIPEDVPYDVLDDYVNRIIEFQEWDKYEQSILTKIASNVRIFIKGRKVDMIVTKNY